MFEFVFEQEIISVLTKFSNKHESKWSRNLATAVLDDSVYKQWLQKTEAKKAYDECYGRFFSGQVGHIVYGFQSVTFGLVIEEVFYPLYFESVKKEEIKYNEKGKKVYRKDKATVDVAPKLINKWALFVKKIRLKGLEISKIYFSCDSGYSDVALCDLCLNAGLIYISVPKRNHKIEHNNAQININDWIQDVFIPLENEHKTEEKDLKEEEKTDFTYRFRIFYKSQNREVTFLAFRLNGSNKVTLIYTPDKISKDSHSEGIGLIELTLIGPPMRQFFKILKHYMNIQASITVSKHTFEAKLFRFAFVALHIQLLVKMMKRKLPQYKNNGFGFIRILMQSDPEILDLLQKNIYLNIK